MSEFFISQGGRALVCTRWGDIAVVSHSSAFYGIAVKIIKPDVLAALIGFQEV